MRTSLILLIVAAGIIRSQAPHVTLTGLALLPADSFAAGPPSGAWLEAGKIGTPQFSSQPVQGVSAVWPGSAAGEWLALSDNGFGTKLNSADYLLRIYRVRIDWSAARVPGTVTPVGFIQLADPDHKLRFALTREMTRERWLTGADLDPESLVRLPDGTFWIGDEFGPFLLHFDADGRLLESPYEVPMTRSPDHPQISAPDGSPTSTATVRRSRGFEGLAHLGDELYAAIETGTGADADAARIHEFSLSKREFTGQTWRLPLTSPEHALSELVSLAAVAPECAARFLAIERDSGHGGEAKLKRVREVQLAGNAVVSHVVADLLAIHNPQQIGGHATQFTFPFVTTEAIWATRVDELVIANDNNYPAGGGRPGSTRDHTEFIRLRLSTPLCTA